MRVLISGAGGLIGSEASHFYLTEGHQVYGIENNKRMEFFGPKADVRPVIQDLEKNPSFQNTQLDITDFEKVTAFFKEHEPFDLIIHTAAQPSHDLAAKIPLDDFKVNALGTLHMLEGLRNYSPKAVFIFTSTNKVYGDNPNRVALIEQETRYDYDSSQNMSGVSIQGISEAMSLDQCTHSVFGVSKTAADLMVQEYGKNFKLQTGVFRGGCLTGPQHRAVPLHGFLNYIVSCGIKQEPYIIIGYQGKQVRDQIHAADVISAFEAFRKNPRAGEAYNLGGGKENAASILEVLNLLEEMGIRPPTKYEPTPRVGDHICYYTDMDKFKTHYPQWKKKYDLEKIIKEMIGDC